MGGINLNYPAGFTSAMLIADTVTSTNASTDSLATFTRVGGNPVSACLELQSTNGGLLVSRMTTAQRLALVVANGMVVYDTDLESFMFYENNAWAGIPGVVIPTVVNDIAVFNDTQGTLIDSDTRLLQNFAQQTLFLGRNTGSVTALAGNSVISFGLSNLPAIGNGSVSTVCVGSGIALHATDVDNCTFMGDNVASALGSGNLTELTAFGSQALADVTQNASELTAIGTFAMQVATTADRCTAVGWGSLATITDTVDATAVGAESLAAATTAIETTAIGAKAGALRTQYTSCTFIGNEADASVNNLSFACAIGAGAVVDKNNAIALGTIGIQVGIGISSPNAQLHVAYSGSGGGIIFPFRIDNVNANINVSYNDFMVQSGQNFVTFTLPVADADHAGQFFVLKKATSANLPNGLCTVQTQGGQQIDGSNNQQSGTGWASFRVYTDGSNWFTF